MGRTTSVTIRLSKSKFTTELQCHRRLWWSVHEPAAPELTNDAVQQAIFDQGTRVGELARTYFPDGVLIDLPHDALADRVEATRLAIAGGAKVVYEAAFWADDVFVSVDVLHRARRGWNLTEVKSTTKLKDEHIADVAVQTHVVRRAGVKVVRAELMHLNRECRHPDLSDLFARQNVTQQVEAALPWIPREIAVQRAMLQRSRAPAVEVGDHCGQPYACPFVDRCWGEAPRHHIGTLYRLRTSKRAELEARNIETIDAIPPDVPLAPVQARQRRAVRSRRMVVERDLAEALTAFEPPVAHLDFETIAPAIPVWGGCRPYDAVPVQFSCHIEGTRGAVRHVEWLADGPSDPRRPISGALVAAVARARTIVVYSEGFETHRLRELAEAVPELAGELEDMILRVRDLLPIVRAHVYHPAFLGSFSLKDVTAALVPALRHSRLAIGDGRSASAQLETLMLRADTLQSARRREIGRDLLAYCANDTLATVGILRRLRELALR